jgi:hypothetical protein
LATHAKQNQFHIARYFTINQKCEKLADEFRNGESGGRWLCMKIEFFKQKKLLYINDINHNTSEPRCRFFIFRT